MMMKPTDDKCTYTSIDVGAKTPPIIVFSSKSVVWIRALVDNHSEEVGFFGVVDDIEPNKYYIRDIFYPKHQLITSGTCEISPEGEAQIVNWLCEHGRVADLPKIRMWGHSHHTMGVFASHQDEQQSLERMRRNETYLIRAIVNKDGKMDVAFFDYERQIKFEHVQWTIEASADPEIQIIIDEKMASIAAIMAENKTASEKLAEIETLAKRDFAAELREAELQEVKEKVLKLKIINAPPSTTVTHQYGHNSNYSNNYGPNYGGRHFDGGYGQIDGDDPWNHPGDTPGVVVVGGQPRSVSGRGRDAGQYNSIVDKHLRGKSKVRKGMRQRFTERFQGGM